jgi:alternate signal-mediated exported protein
VSISHSATQTRNIVPITRFLPPCGAQQPASSGTPSFDTPGVVNGMKMNKLLKGAIAGAAGVALLLGGAGTFALWNSSATVTGGKVVAGNLLVTADSSTGTWTANNVSIDIATFKAVPGDVLKFTKIVNVTASGDKLVATLGLGTASITGSTPNATADTALATYLNANTVLAATGAAITGAGPSYTVTPGTAGITASPVTVTATITFPKNAVAAFENNTKLGSVNLADLTVTLTQVA